VLCGQQLANRKRRGTRALVRLLCSLGINTNKNKWDGRYSSTLTNNVVELAFIIGDPRTHLTLQRFHRKNLDPHIDTITHVEGKVLDKEIISNKRIFTELNLNSHTVLDKVCLVVTKDRYLPCGPQQT
jgi:hypothetical protein